MKYIAQTEGTIEPTTNISDAESIIAEVGAEVEGENAAESTELDIDQIIGAPAESKPTDRAEQVRKSIEELSSQVDDLGVAIYQMKLTDPQLQELTNKVVKLISTTVADITNERVRDIAPDILGAE